ncbi:MAG: integrase [Paraburkholderia sp.]|uniref:tyrosine-type recombinase/integrase n=1 Tax=Paraburkholderia sp. TaxID=1926495 RepID=UPI00121CEE66|nr:tyrosine-type recombinase/integrase [Paraburkholderia sp.]TAM07545.1 MAG: integrase [Paraburkholderia sp.]TAM29684.1 MAG: integrase [Paraburkholderia sp.]
MTAATITSKGQVTIPVDVRNHLGLESGVSDALVVNECGERLMSDALRFRFDRARLIAGVNKNLFQFRDLRAKAGTDKTESAGDIRAAQKQLGHSSVTMTEHYVRERTGDKVGPMK